MIENELLFLGLLKNGPKHGYEIKRLIDEELLPFVGLQIKSIYYPLRKIEQKGLIKKDVGREGRWPEKYVYSLTPKGHKTFDQLITESFRSIQRPYFSIHLSFYFLQYVDKKAAQSQLRGRILFLKRIKNDLERFSQQIKPTQKHLKIIADHDLDLVDAEIQSTSRLAEALTT